MYEPYINEKNQLLPSEFFLPFGGRLNPSLDWIKPAQLVPWTKIDQKYSKSSKKSYVGCTRKK